MKFWLRSTFALPVALNLLGLAGICLALLGNGLWDISAWCCLGIMLGLPVLIWMRGKRST